MDGHSSHILTKALEFYIASNIIVLCLPSHSTHITQPLDVGIFRPLAMAYSKGVLEKGEYSPIYSVDKLQFLEIYQHARQVAITKSNIASAWKKAGLEPFDLKSVLELLPKPFESTDSTTILECPSTPVRTTPQDLVNYYLQVPNTPSNCQEVEVLFHNLYRQGVLNSTNIQILRKIEKGATKAFTTSTIQQITNDKLLQAVKEGQKRKFTKAQGYRRVIGVEVLMQRQAEFSQKVIDSI